MAKRVKTVVCATLVGLLGAGLLSGCANRPSVAAQVEDTSFSFRQVDSIKAGCAEVMRKEGVSENTIREVEPTFLVQLVNAQAIIEAGKSFGIEIDDKTVQEVISSDADLTKLNANNECAPLAKISARAGVVGTMLVAGGLADKNSFSDRLAEIKVNVNPAAGKWDPAKGLSLDTSRSLSTPAEMDQLTRR